MRPRLLVLLFPCLLSAQSLKEFEKKVTEFTLPNGLHFLVIERHEAPVISFHTYVNVGSVDDPGGQTGLAHMFEHMAFKGTPTIGTKNWPEEKKALDAVDAAYSRLDLEKSKGRLAGPEKVKKLEGDVEEAIDKAETYVEPNEYDRVVETNGGLDMNAGTGEDSTDYFYSFPANRMELWFLLESSRFLQPVFREFYKERDVVREERRMRIESSPQGKLVEALVAVAFSAAPYRNMPGGWASDIDNFRRPDAERFYNQYYVPANITIGIAGDVKPQEARRLAEKYFARLPAHPLPVAKRTEEPVQEGERRVAVSSPAQPFMIIAYKRPDQYSKDDAALDVLSEVLSGGRTSIVYKDMVRDKQMALAAGAQSTFPGGKYPSLFLFFVAPNTGHPVEENEKEIYSIIERAKKEKPDEETLTRVKTKLRAELIRKLASNSGLASELCTYAANFGDWRKLFTELEDYEKVTAEDVQRVARTYLVDDHRTVAYTFVPPEGSAPPAEAVPEGGQTAPAGGKP
ncbi:MAG TPA: pitrilysin family protein [Bryobacteraceae bacterium]|nr:pitrilysin family protein [Bryobacteraceae bacterium]